MMFSVINVTLPDEKANYLHRIGRVGRAERSLLLYLCSYSRGDHKQKSNELLVEMEGMVKKIEEKYIVHILQIM